MSGPTINSPRISKKLNRTNETSSKEDEGNQRCNDQRTQVSAYSSKKGQIHVPPKKKGKWDYSYSRRHCRNENETIPEKLVPDDKSAKTDKNNAMEKKIPHDPNEGRGNK